MVIVSEWIGFVLASIVCARIDIAQCNIADSFYRLCE
jgi:hypothetical protein